MATGKGGQFSARGSGRVTGVKPGGLNSYRASQTKSFGKLGNTLRHGTGGSGGKRSGGKRTRAR